MRLIDLTGRRFGRLTVLHRGESHISPKGTKSVRWVCLCDCGKHTTVLGANLRHGRQVSCGCYKIDHPQNYKHGGCYTRLYGVWEGMKSRCCDEKNKRFSNYGGRGISICEEWLDFATFRDWALSSRYKKGLTIDRIDVDGNYEPSNCRWVTMKVQQNNRTNNHRIAHNGKTLTLSEWADECQINRDTFKRRIALGWSMERATTTPVRKRREV